MVEIQPGTLAPFRLPPPRHADDAFEPYIRAATVRQQRLWQQTQMEAVNDALAAHPEWLGLTIEALLRRLAEMPPELGRVVSTSGASHANHQFLWKILSPAPNPEPSATLAHAINQDFGSLARLRDAFDDAALSLRGDGWAFLVMNPDRGMKLEVLALPGDASVLALRRPGLLVCDLWEHAWAGDHIDRRSWLDAFWPLVDWPAVAARREGILQGLKQL